MRYNIELVIFGRLYLDRATRNKTKHASFYGMLVVLLFVFFYTLPTTYAAMNHHIASQKTFSDDTSHIANESITYQGSVTSSESVKPLLVKLNQMSNDGQAPFDFDAHTMLNRSAATYFQAEPQTLPDYALEVEFFPIGLLSASFVKLSNPDKEVRWFETQQSSKPSSRLSLWKDGNQLYSCSINYLS